MLVCVATDGKYDDVILLPTARPLSPAVFFWRMIKLRSTVPPAGLFTYESTGSGDIPSPISL